MCFKCGAVAHPGTSCNSVGNAELREYIKNSNVVKCPNCGFGTEKIDGCNHMTCAKCRYDWCWLCRGKYYDGHFEEWNMFGCPGGQYGSENACLNVAKKVAMIIFMPLVLFFGASGITMHALCYNLSNCDMHCLWQILIFFILIMPIGLVAGALACVLTPFAILFQIYLLLKILFKLLGQYCSCLFCCCCCCCR